MSERPIPEEKRGNYCLQQKKENAIGSLFEVEHFLCNFTQVLKGIKIFNIIKY